MYFPITVEACSPNLKRQRLRHPRPAAPDLPDAALVETISEREIEVLALLADSLTYQEIAQTMFVSVNTIKSHLKSIYGKLDVHNRREAVARARVLHLLDANE